MKFQYLVVAALLCLVLIGGSHARELKADEDYWKVVLPNTPIPSTLLDLLKTGAEDAEIDNLFKKNNDVQYAENFFLQRDLHPGHTVNVKFGRISGPHFYLLQSLHDAKKVVTFEDVCTKKPRSDAEQKHCAKSLGELIDFAILKLGKNIDVFSSSFIGKQNNYTIEGVQKLGEKVVTCHKMNFQKVVFVCHEVKETIAYKVPMVAADGTKTHVIAICHFDTSVMHPDMLYELLKIKPGTEAACHFIENEAVLLVPNLDLENPYRTSLGI